MWEVKSSPKLFSIGAQRKDKRWQAQPEIKEIHLNIQKNFFIVRVVITRKQIAQRGCGVPILGDIQTPNGHSPEQPAPSCPGSEQWGWTSHPSNSVILHTWPGSFQSLLDRNSSSLSRKLSYFVYRSIDFF